MATFLRRKASSIDGRSAQIESTTQDSRERLTDSEWRWVLASLCIALVGVVVFMCADRTVESSPSVELIAEAAHPYAKLPLTAASNPSAAKRSVTERARGETPLLIGPPSNYPLAERGHLYGPGKVVSV